MRTVLRLLPVVVAAVFLSLVSTSHAENEGQDDLSAAIDKRLATQKSLADLETIIRLCESAIQKGLDESNTKLANNVLTSTLLERANERTRLIVTQVPPNWAQLRQQALEDLEQALKRDPKLAKAHLLVARLQSLPPGDRVAAEKAAEKAVELAGDDAETKVESLIVSANLTDEVAKKLDLINQAANLVPNNSEVLRMRGIVLLAVGKVAEAVADFQALVKADPKNAEALNDLGSALMLANRDNEAVEAFGAAIEQSPEEPRWYLNRARAYLLGRHFGKALEDLDYTHKLAPGNPLVLLFRARANQGAGNLDAAKDDIAAALKDRPQMPPAALAILSLGSENVHQAAADLEELVKVVPNNAALSAQLGMVYLGNKQPHKSIEKCAAALEQDPENYLALRTRADALLSVGQHAEAIADYEKAIRMKPNDDGVLNNLAWVLATSPDDKLRDGKRSIEIAKRACEATGYRKATMLSTLAAAYAETGDWEKAVEWSKKAAEAGDEADDTSDQLQRELASYEAKKPWREKQEMKDETPPKAENNGAATPEDSAAK
ncbi:MAG: tetratricopeptide repeat protein [Pirellulales bacterium]|nr:tetratricopeptide repeat protein [Pirellulales bacterium]